VDATARLYISEEEVDALVAATGAAAPPVQIDCEECAIVDRLTTLEALIALRKSASREEGADLRLEQLRKQFQLTAFDINALLISLAPEIDSKYDTLYAYVQDDLTKRRPTVALVLSLLCLSFEAKLSARQRFTASAPLLEHSLLHFVHDASLGSSSLLSRALAVDERIANYLFNGDAIDSRLVPYSQLVTPQGCFATLILSRETKQHLLRLARLSAAPRGQVVFYFQGPDGVGKQTTAEALCQERGYTLLVIDCERAAAVEPLGFAATVRLAVREAKLQNAALYWKNFDVLLTDDKRSACEALLRELTDYDGLTFLAGTVAWEPTDVRHQSLFVHLEFPLPTYAERVQLWTAASSEQAIDTSHVDVPALANQFRLSGGQIRDAAVTARNHAQWRSPEHKQVTMVDLTTACRLHSNRKLAALAQKITPRYAWEALVLPADRLRQLRELCNSVKYRALVYDEWGFDRKLSLGKGVNALFAGPSGTGKTMAAEVLASELGLDLYKIDLSTVVSKYIGETEKNLSRIFAEATTSNAILFFDEADALFGKRSEVKDAHDRYANIEIGYLLQRMEEYDGVVILATNLHKNMDDAFVRRMHFTIEFPFPSVQDRLRIWQTPRSPDLPWDLLARRFEITGGNIRNIALAAAFLAASDSGVINLEHLLHATRREYQKMGKVITEAEFMRIAENEKVTPL
jgi:ATP-dependent 26S proteasome regulatory subunit